MTKYNTVTNRNFRHVNRTIKKLHSENENLNKLIKVLYKRIDTYRDFLDVIFSTNFVLQEVKPELTVEVESEVQAETEQ